MHYSYSPQFRRILKEWASCIGKENYFTIETYKAHPGSFPLYNIKNTGGFKTTDTILDFQVRCPYCHTIHTCHVPDQSNEIEYISLYFTQCTHCNEIFHLLSNFIPETPNHTVKFITIPSTEEAQHNRRNIDRSLDRIQQDRNPLSPPSAIPCAPLKNENILQFTPNSKIDIILGTIFILIIVSASLITFLNDKTPWHIHWWLDTSRIIFGLYTGANFLYFGIFIITLNLGHYEEPHTITGKILLLPNYLFWFFPSILYRAYTSLINLIRSLKKAPTDLPKYLFPLALCALLGIATADMPYGYYTFLRIAVTIWGIITIIRSYYQLHSHPIQNFHGILTGAITILYNPIIPIHLDKEHWTIINLITIPLILIVTHLPTQKHNP